MNTELEKPNLALVPKINNLVPLRVYTGSIRKCNLEPKGWVYWLPCPRCNEITLAKALEGFICGNGESMAYYHRFIPACKSFRFFFFTVEAKVTIDPRMQYSGRVRIATQGESIRTEIKFRVDLSDCSSNEVAVPYQISVRPYKQGDFV